MFAGSIIFYAVGDAEYVLLLLWCVLVNYLAVRVMGGAAVKERTGWKKLLFILTLCYDFGVLFLYKYSGIVGELPLGISFYTFQILSYVIDVYRGDVPVQRNFIDLAMYVAMFPQLIAGPIVRYSDIAGSLKNRKTTLADAFMSFKSMFGFAGIPAVNAASLYYLKSNLVLLIAAAVGATPLPKRINEKIGGTAGGSRVLAVLTPMAAAAAVAVCTAYLIDGSFNPFVYFRF